MQPIRTQSLVLEPLVVAHAAEMFAVLSDPAIYEFENEPPESEEALARRYAVLEGRRSKDGSQIWLNWVIRLPDGQLAGYVQATVLASGAAYVAYELASRFWRQGIGSTAVAAMLGELRTNYAVNLYVSVLKARNHRSLALLHKLGFEPARADQAATFGAEADERVMVKSASASPEFQVHHNAFAMAAINLADKLATFEDHWQPRVIGQFNGHDLMVVKVKGEFVWHRHEDTDDFFLVLKGRITIRMREGDVSLGPGELFVVPRGAEHCPVAEEEAHLLLIEPSGTPNTGNAATAAPRRVV